MIAAQIIRLPLIPSPFTKNILRRQIARQVYCLAAAGRFPESSRCNHSYNPSVFSGIVRRIRII
jgi:hypothetical protein